LWKSDDKGRGTLLNPNVDTAQLQGSDGQRSTRRSDVLANTEIESTSKPRLREYDSRQCSLRDQETLADKKLNGKGRTDQLAAHRREAEKAVAKEGRFHLPAKGFTIEGAEVHFELTGDLKR
jgi:hypothetical protein